LTPAILRRYFIDNISAPPFCPNKKNTRLSVIVSRFFNSYRFQQYHGCPWTTHSRSTANAPPPTTCIHGWVQRTQWRRRRRNRLRPGGVLSHSRRIVDDISYVAGVSYQRIPPLLHWLYITILKKIIIPLRLLWFSNGVTRTYSRTYALSSSDIYVKFKYK